MTNRLNLQFNLSWRHILLAFVLAGLGGLFYLRGSVSATPISELRDQVSQLEAEIEENEKKLAKTRKERKTLENEVYALDLEIGNTQRKIDATNKKIQTLELEIKEAEAELKHQEEILGESLRQLYKRGDITTIELLASTGSYSEFINEQEYLSRLKGAIQESAAQVQELKDELEERREEQVDLAEQLEGQRRILDRKRSERAQILAETRGQESAFQNRVKRLQKQQEELLAEIVARSQVITGVGTGSYPWADYRQGSWTHQDSCAYPDDGDEWGYCYRQCTSFAAWRLYSTGRSAPINYGNATDWGVRAQADGVPTGSQPKVGAIAVWQGFEGHVAFVEEVYGNGNARISEYNAVPPLGGKYSQRIIDGGDPAMYIYFE